MRRVAFAGALALPLGSCSYGYEVTAVLLDGRLGFEADPDTGWFGQDCVRQISLEREDGIALTAEPGDDASRTGRGTVWFRSIDNEDRCFNEFPLRYGQALAGRPDTDRGFVEAKPIEREVIYDVLTTSGVTGYGYGKFKIAADGSVQNVPRD